MFLYQQVIIKCVGIFFFRGNDPDRLNRPYTAGTKCGHCPRSCKSPCYRRTCYLCTNACSYSDMWLNCGQLNQAWHEWLCNTKTVQGVERFKNCRATCECANEITWEFLTWVWTPISMHIGKSYIINAYKLWYKRSWRMFCQFPSWSKTNYLYYAVPSNPSHHESGVQISAQILFVWEAHLYRSLCPHMNN